MGAFERLPDHVVVNGSRRQAERHVLADRAEDEGDGLRDVGDGSWPAGDRLTRRHSADRDGPLVRLEDADDDVR